MKERIQQISSSCLPWCFPLHIPSEASRTYLPADSQPGVLLSLVLGDVLAAPLPIYRPSRPSSLTPSAWVKLIRTPFAPNDFLNCELQKPLIRTCYTEILRVRKVINFRGTTPCFNLRLSDAQTPKDTWKFYFNWVFNTFQAHQWLWFPGPCDQHLWTAHNAFYFWCKKVFEWE